MPLLRTSAAACAEWYGQVLGWLDARLRSAQRAHLCSRACVQGPLLSCAANPVGGTRCHPGTKIGYVTLLQPCSPNHCYHPPHQVHQPMHFPPLFLLFPLTSPPPSCIFYSRTAGLFAGPCSFLFICYRPLRSLIVFPPPSGTAYIDFSCGKPIPSATPSPPASPVTPSSPGSATPPPPTPLTHPPTSPSTPGSGAAAPPSGTSFPPVNDDDGDGHGGKEHGGGGGDDRDGESDDDDDHGRDGDGDPDGDNGGEYSTAPPSSHSPSSSVPSRSSSSPSGCTASTLPNYSCMLDLSGSE